MDPEDADVKVELVPIAALQAHPQNYRSHPASQLDHIAQSIKEHGFYRNIVTSRDLTILAGHGVWQAAKSLGIRRVPVHRLDVEFDSPKALKVLTADNELGHFAEDNDRLLADLLKTIRDEDETGLLGTGYDDMMLASLLMVTRPASEVEDFDAAAQWVGMPTYEYGAVSGPKLVITFPNQEERERFVTMHDLRIDQRHERIAWNTRWPWSDRDDETSLAFAQGDEDVSDDDPA